MLDMINEINSKLSLIVEDLRAERDILSDSLSSVQEKIDSKIDEAKRYKVSVDSYKEEMGALEREILSLEHDLDTLKENYGTKGFEAIVEVGTKEITAKIVSKQKELAKEAQKINELTDRARTIKDLLINLKKDKQEKKERLDNLNVLIEYYNAEFMKIVDYSTSNADALVVVPAEEVDYDFDVPIIEDVVDDSPVFDEIESIDKEENLEETEEAVEEDGLNVELPETGEIEDNSLFVGFDNIFNEPKEEDLIVPAQEVKEEPINLTNKIEVNDFDFESMELDISDLFSKREKGIVSEEKEEESHLDDTISSLFAKEEKTSVNFKKLNETIDKEYENIFGNSEEIKFDYDFNTKDNNLGFNIFESNVSFEDTLNSKKEDINNQLKEKASYDKGSINDDIVTNFFVTNKLDINKFTVVDQNYIKKIFSPISFAKLLEVLRKNDIDTERIYSNVKLFEMNSNELDGMISKLLICGQTKENISLVLNTLPLITLIDLNEVIESFGRNIKKVDITEIIIKAKHLKDVGGLGE